MGTLDLVNPMKLIITPSTHLSQMMPTPSNGLDQEIDESITFSVSGDLREGSWIIIMKSSKSRIQRLVGESRGKQLLRKNVRESKWMTSFEFEDQSVYSQLLMSAVCFLTVADF
jgi:hypothetical protein